MNFCTKCGSPRVAGSNFCTVCGAAHPPAEPLPQPSPAMPAPAAQPAYTPVPAAYAPVNAPAPGPPLGPKKSNTLLKVIIAVFVILFIGVGLTVAGLYWAAQKVKEKVHSVTSQVLTGVPPSANAPSSPSGPPPPPAPSSFPGWSPSAVSTPNSTNPAPAKTGMLVVTAIASPRGDYESMKQIVSMDDSGITLSYRAEGSKAGGGGARVMRCQSSVWCWLKIWIRPTITLRFSIAQRLDLSRVLRRLPLPGRCSRSSSRRALPRLVFVRRGSQVPLVR